MAATLRFEPLREDHLPAILEIERQVNGSPWSEKSFRNEIDHPHGIFRVAIEGGQVVGYGGLWLVIDEAHVTNVAIAPTHQRQGIGRRLMVQLLEAAKSAGMICATLEVRAGNGPALHLYESLGFERTAVRRGYYPDNKEDAVVMWRHNLDDL
ncbi:ribosomal-protein-alanine N-acetyltransferase [bacterium]|nr:MAG: ribosomal-protein-alanine N-acetyltransferase [bacterium]